MINEYVIIPDIFDPEAYSDPAYIEICLPHLKEPLLQEALVRDIYDGGWSDFCTENAGSLHRLCKEILKKLRTSNRLYTFPAQAKSCPVTPEEWCQEGLAGHNVAPVTGIIAAHTTKQNHKNIEVASIEKLTGTPWWQARSPSVTPDRKIPDYLNELGLILEQANSLMFIDPNLDPSSANYRFFHQLLTPVASRNIKPRIEIHRSFCKGDGPARTFPEQEQWKVAFSNLSRELEKLDLSAEVFFWEDFHDRFFISDIIGISVQAGFDTTNKPNDLSTWGRLGRDDKDKIQRLYDPATRQESLKFSFTIGKA